MAANPSSHPSPVRDFDQDSVRIHDVCGPAAGPVNGGVVALKAQPERMNTTDGLVHVIEDESDVVDMDAIMAETLVI
jgi:hypothetical protein